MPRTAKIIVIKDKPIDQFLITGATTTIGRRSACDISISDPAVSGKHAQIQRIKDDYLIQDLGSTNGLMYEGRKIKQQVLKNNDVVLVGEHKLKFVLIEPVAGPRKPANTLSNASSAGAYLDILTGPDTGQEINLEEGLTTIGQPGVQVAAISRRPQGHFIIHVDGEKDKGRVPLVNGEPTGFKSRKLEPGDKVEVAGIAMEYHA